MTLSVSRSTHRKTDIAIVLFKHRRPLCHRTDGLKPVKGEKGRCCSFLCCNIYGKKEKTMMMMDVNFMGNEGVVA
nr:hypothetical protein Iba_scaffold39942CG0010 [Ipomoea batatas]GMD17885.1 hypothetical protein Iba_chr07dCG7920 [Ipomoea batatas]